MTDSIAIVLTDTESSKLDNARGSAAAVVTAARDLTVETEQEARRAGEILRYLQTVRKRADADRMALTKPYREHVATINANYKGPAKMLDEADKVIRQKVKAYNAEQERIRAERQATIDAAEAEQARKDAEQRDRKAAAAREQQARWEAEAKTRTDEASAEAARKAAEAMEQVARAREVEALPVRFVEQAPAVQPVSKGVATTKRWTFEIVNQAIVPEKFKIVDETAIRKRMREDVKAGHPPSLIGIRFYQEESLSVRGR